MSEGPCLHREWFPTHFGPLLIPTDDHPVLINMEGLGCGLDQFVHLQVFVVLFNESDRCSGEFCYSRNPPITVASVSMHSPAKGSVGNGCKYSAGRFPSYPRVLLVAVFQVQFGMLHRCDEVNKESYPSLPRF